MPSINRFTNREAQSLFKAISALYADQFTTPLTQRVFDAVRNVASADWYALDSFHPQGYWLDKSWVEPLTGVSHADLVAFGEYCHEHPLYTAFVQTGLPQPRKTSDYVTTQQFQRLNIYNEFFRRVGTNRQIVCGLSVSSELTLVLSLNRNKKDFTESHCQQLEALRPHLIAAHRDAVALAHLQFQQVQLQVALEQTGAGAILIDADGSVQLITAQAEVWLAKYFDPAHGTTRDLPDRIKNWIALHRVDQARYGVFVEPVPPLEISQDNGSLRARFLTDGASHQILLVLEEDVPTSASALESLGLTHREAEILNWLTQGKTNPEIAILCDISERTVHKHLEHIYQKLGVETRTAAARQAMSIITSLRSSRKAFY